MVTAKTKRTIAALCSLHGPSIPTYPGSAHEDTELDAAELILHELGHIVQNPERFSIDPANMEPESTALGTYLTQLPDWRSDLHEMRAIAIELLAARKLGLRLTGYKIIESSLQNTKLFHAFNKNSYDSDRYLRFIARIKKHRYTQRCADTIFRRVERERRRLYGYSPVSRSTQRKPRSAGRAR